jgi:hypothetical protein
VLSPLRGFCQIDALLAMAALTAAQRLSRRSRFALFPPRGELEHLQ